MPTEGFAHVVDVRCSGCGTAGVPTVAEAADGGADATLSTRLAKGPAASGTRPGRIDSCTDVLELLALFAIAGGALYTGLTDHKPLYTIGGGAGLLLLLLATGVLVSGGDSAKEMEREALARELWRPAHYCGACDLVFCPGGDPWSGALTPEQFKKLVWTRAGYVKQLPKRDKARAAEVPAGTLPEAE